ncbi:MAG: riboflavin synthase subunit alpha [Burkholderiaceae bacterium]|nr:riboflavin synthase subunit alpha [Burkholderiaceae bacterium]
MFTGIVQTTGRIVAVEPLGFGRRLTIEAPALGLDEVQVGDSIAVNGACMTVTARQASCFSIDVSAESLSKTAGLDAMGEVNLERAMRVGDRLDGHIVSGHVDGTGIVSTMEPVGESWSFAVDAPPELARYLAYKGSVAVNGVSLTVNRVEDIAPGAPSACCRIWINLIPHTIEVTTLRNLKPGDKVNLEVDMIARYLERMLPAALRG